MGPVHDGCMSERCPGLVFCKLRLLSTSSPVIFCEAALQGFSQAAVLPAALDLTHGQPSRQAGPSASPSRDERPQARRRRLQRGRRRPAATLSGGGAAAVQREDAHA